MLDFIKSMISNDSMISSARFINICGFFTATGLIIYDITLKHGLDNINFAAYLTYCAGGYAASKYLDNKKDTNVAS